MLALEFMRVLGWVQAYRALPVHLDVDAMQAVQVLLGRITSALDEGNAIEALQGKIELLG